MSLDIPNHKEIFGQRDAREQETTLNTSESYITVTAENNLTDERVLTAGEGIDITDGGAGTTITIAGEDATTANKGIASFSTDDFAVAAGAVSLKSVTRYWSIPGGDFLAMENGTGFFYVSGTPGEVCEQGTGEFGMGIEASVTANFAAGVHLPDGAVVTACIVYGEDTNDTWELKRVLLTNAATRDVMGTGTFDTADSSISNATIDNSLYAYIITTGSVANGSQLDGARITYTIDQLA